MMKELVTDYTKILEEQGCELGYDYPMGSYIPSWRIFRAFAKENEIIAKHIITNTDFCNPNINNIFDIGTGDGKILNKLIQMKIGSIESLTILEPNAKLITEAEFNLIDFIKYTTSLQMNIQSYIENLSSSAVDVYLLIHVLYLLPEKWIKQVLFTLSNNSKLIVITDEQDSLFSNCWRMFSPKYYRRANFIHSVINQLKKNGKEIKISSLKTYLLNPFIIKRHDLREALISMITYSDFNTFSSNNIIELNSIFERYSVGDTIACNSICYEIN